MNIIETDVAVIGAGTAGLAAYREAAAAGRRSVIIEGGPHGTTCARVGCMPSKLLIAAADAHHATGRLERFGIRLETRPEVDRRAVMQRVRTERDRFVGFVLEGVDSIPEADRLSGFARFEDSHTLRVGDHTRVRFRSAVIATGSSPAIAPLLRGAEDRLIVNDDVFDWEDLPHAVAVFGPGVIGLELGQALHRLGVEVHVFGRDGLIGPLSDPALRSYATKTFGTEFPLDTDADVKTVARTADGVRIAYVGREGRIREVDVDYVIAATGRRPNVHALGLDLTGLRLDSRGVPAFDPETLQCGTSHIFIAGDANNDRPLLHEAADEGRIAGRNAATWPCTARGLRRAPLAVVFSDPQIAIVGRRHTDLVAGTTVTGTASFENQGRSRVMLRNQGLLHVYADVATRAFVGLEMIGPDAEHIGHLAAWALQCRLTVDDMLDMPFYHPVVEEGFRTALRDAQARLNASARAPESLAA